MPADCSRDEWVSIGMALHWAGTQTDQLEQALVLWNEWSATAQTKYPGEREILTQWVSFRPDKATAVKLGTLFHIAKQHGWQRPTPDAAALFRWAAAFFASILRSRGSKSCSADTRPIRSFVRPWRTSSMSGKTGIGER